MLLTPVNILKIFKNSFQKKRSLRIYINGTTFLLFSGKIISIFITEIACTPLLAEP